MPFLLDGRKPGLRTRQSPRRKQRKIASGRAHEGTQQSGGGIMKASNYRLCAERTTTALRLQNYSEMAGSFMAAQ